MSIQEERLTVDSDGFIAVKDAHSELYHSKPKISFEEEVKESIFDSSEPSNLRYEIETSTLPERSLRSSRLTLPDMKDGQTWKNSDLESRSEDSRAVRKSKLRETFTNLKIRAKKRSNIQSVARFVAKYAPLFVISRYLRRMCRKVSFYCSFSWEPMKEDSYISLTDRDVLARLNILSLIFSIGQVALGMFLTWFYIILPDCYSAECASDYIPNFWNPTNSVLGLTFFASLLSISCIFGMRMIQHVSIVGAIYYFWVLQYILPYEIMLVVNLLDYNDVTDVFVKHWWVSPSFDWFRERCKFANERNKLLFSSHLSS